MGKKHNLVLPSKGLMTIEGSGKKLSESVDTIYCNRRCSRNKASPEGSTELW